LILFTVAKTYGGKRSSLAKLLFISLPRLILIKDLVSGLWFVVSGFF